MTLPRLMNGNVGIALLLGAAGLGWMGGSFKYGFWRGFAPGPGFLPFCYGALLFLLAVAILIQCVKTTEESLQREDHSWKSFIVMLLIALTLVGMEVVGFATAAFVALAVMFVVLEKRRIILSLVVAFATTAVIHLLLVVWLRVPLPLGPLGV